MAEETAKEKKGRAFLDKFAMVAAKVGNQIHLRSLRDAFATIMPLYILAGIAVLINNVIFPLFMKDPILTNAQVWGNLLVNGTLNIAGLAIAPVIGYCLSKNKRFDNPIAAAVISLAALIVMMPLNTEATLASNADKTAMVTGVLTFKNLGTSGMFAGIIIGLLATEFFIRISSVKKLQIHLGEGVPPAVEKSFNVLIPNLIVLACFGIIAAILSVAGNTDLITLISKMVQEPLRNVNTSLAGCLLIYSVGNLLFTLGIHQAVIYGVLLEPLLIANINDNMVAFAAHQAIPHIMNVSLVTSFGLIGGSGCTLCLMIATLIFGKYKPTKDIVKMAAVPGVFNINEPIIFGYPIVFNMALMLPFILLPVIGISLAYFATSIGLVNPCVVLTPWTTPVFVSGFLATGGDWRAIVLQLVIVIIGVFLYLPFMKVSEKVTARQMALENEEA
ncbi:MAG: PTS transporter subunit EIIC [Eubacteriaceae bacterium]|nr:PTS transporter subunit EIIC [Eubacteriaceae bacterium]